MAGQDAYAHPKLVFFHLFFKSAALLIYIFGSAFLTSSFVINFVMCVFLLAIDFWTVKNVSGRILVGLRWWSETDDNGEIIWKFESLDQQALDQLSKPDSWLFWWTLYITPAAWLLLGLIAILQFNLNRLNYLLIVAVALFFGSANIIGFTKCRKDAKQQIQQFASHTVASHLQSTLSTAFAV